MNNLHKIILNNTIYLYSYLSTYGVDRLNIRKDLIVIILLNDLFKDNNFYNLLSESDIVLINTIIKNIQNSNPRLKYSLNNCAEFTCINTINNNSKCMTLVPLPINK